MMAVGAAAPAPAPDRALAAAERFEAMALGEFLAPMFATVDMSATPFGGGEAEKTWQSVFVEELGKQLSRAGGLGIARTVDGEMVRLQAGAAHGAGDGRAA